MLAARRLTRAAIGIVAAAGAALLYACADNGAPPPTGPSAGSAGLDFRAAAAVLRRHTPALLDRPGVLGTAVTRLPDGRLAMQILLERSGVAALPPAIDGVPVTTRVTGRIMAFSDPTRRRRPAPLGYSVGHPAITAGTIGARVRDALGRVYILSNNHVLANTNGADVGDAEYQPGPFDGGAAVDQIATLADYQPIAFTGSSTNTMDAAIALSSVDVLDNATPSDDGYGMPSSRIYGDADGDGLIDDRNALLGLDVQKYGRTTRLTHGQITGVNATVTVCYAASGFTCTKSARFVDQLIIAPGGFSNGGDSGSLIVTDDAAMSPVGLLFAGSSSVTIANRIDLVLLRFGVTIDGFAPPPPGPFTDLAVIGLTGPSSGAAVQGQTAGVSVTVKNFGNQDVPSTFTVVLRDTTEHTTVGTRTVAGLAAGASATVAFDWTPTTVGDHVLLASQTFADDRSTDDQRFAAIPVEPPLTDVAVTSVSGGEVIVGHGINVGVTVQNVGNQGVPGFEVTLRDATAGTTIGTRSVGALAPGANTTVVFAWNTTDAALGHHTIVASHTLGDDEASNNQGSAIVQVKPKPMDVAATGITAPQRVHQGDTAHVIVTVKNVGERDVAASFDIVLTDGAAGNAVVGTRSVAALAIGASATVDIPWSTAGADTVGHTLFATHKLADDNPNNNAIAISVIVRPRPIMDVAVSSVSAPATVTQGSTVSIPVTIQNAGGQAVSSAFNLVLTDATTGVTIGTQAIPGLTVGGITTRAFSWSAAGAVLGSHTLVASHNLADANAANDSKSAAVTVVAPSTDISVASISAPGSIAKGGTATIGVTVQNVGGLGVGTFSVVLTDATAGMTIGTQAVSGLAVGASTSRSFSWSTGAAAVGGHTLVASHTVTDDDPSNDQRSITVTVNAAPADLALISITAPSSVTQGDTAAIVATVQNVGGADVTAGFDVVLIDGSAGNAVIGTQTIPGLATGATASRTFSWSTAGAALNGHILTATQNFPDNNSGNNARAIMVSVNPPSVHVGDLDGVAATGADGWAATVVIAVHDQKHQPVNGVTVQGNWNGSGAAATCVTSDLGTCSVVLASIVTTTSMVSFGVTGMSLAGYVYKPVGNHDVDGGTNGYSIFVKRP
jgi:hypothetical protein